MRLTDADDEGDDVRLPKHETSITNHHSFHPNNFPCLVTSSSLLSKPSTYCSIIKEYVVLIEISLKYFEYEDVPKKIQDRLN